MSDRIERALARKILEHATDYKWSLQGFGMLRLYLAPDVRLHVWSESHRAKDVSLIHDHPWHFTSHVLSRGITNIRYRLEPDGNAHTHVTERIRCGPGGGALGNARLVRLVAQEHEIVPAGARYSQRSYEIHESYPRDGAVSIIHRTLDTTADTEHAWVYYPIDKNWVSAEPRDATREEVINITTNALRLWI